jgi:hypothetical protein
MQDLQESRRPQQGAPHVCRRTVVEAEPFLRLPEVTADDVGAGLFITQRSPGKREPALYGEHVASLTFACLEVRIVDGALFLRFCLADLFCEVLF